MTSRAARQGHNVRYCLQYHEDRTSVYFLERACRFFLFCIHFRFQHCFFLFNRIFCYERSRATHQMDGLLSGFSFLATSITSSRSKFDWVVWRLELRSLDQKRQGAGELGHRCVGVDGNRCICCGRGFYRAFAPHHQWDEYYCKTLWAMITCFLLFHYLHFLRCTGWNSPIIKKETGEKVCI